MGQGQIESQIVIGMAVPFIIQWLKRAPWFPLLTEHTDKILKVGFSALVAAGSALAVTFSFDATLGQLTVSGLTWANITGGLQAFLLSLLTQEAAYRTMLKPPKASDHG